MTDHAFSRGDLTIRIMSSGKLAPAVTTYVGDDFVARVSLDAIPAVGATFGGVKRGGYSVTYKVIAVTFSRVVIVEVAA